MNFDFEKLLLFINNSTDFLFSLERAEFESLMCMLAEEYCKHHKLSVTESLDRMAECAHEVNELLGAY